MICLDCRVQEHQNCVDDRLDGARYRSCDCQHVVRPTAEPATGPAGE